MTHDANQKDLADLLADISDAPLDAVQLEQMRAQLANNPNAINEYVEWLQLEAALDWLHVPVPELGELVQEQSAREGEAPAEAGATRPSPIPRSAFHIPRSFSRHNVSTGIAAAIIGIAALLIVLAITPVSQFFATNDNTTDRDEPAPTPAQEIATLTGWHRIDWKDGYHISGKDHRISAGQKVVMNSGVAEITYDTGARVVIEGPAEFVVGRGKDKGETWEPASRSLVSGNSSFVLPPADNSGYLASGRIVARVETDEAKGFTVVTSSAAYEDLGTEFGVEVDSDGVSRVDVFEGKVRTHTRDATGTVAQVVTLTRGQSLRIDTAGNVSEEPTADRKRYQTSLAGARLADAAARNGLIIDDLVDEKNDWTAPGFDRTQFGETRPFITPTAQEGIETAYFNKGEQAIVKAPGFAGHVLQAGTYTIRFAVGNYNNEDGSIIADVNFTGLVLADAAASATPQPASGGWSLWTITWHVPPGSQHIGKPLTFRFETHEGCTNGTFDGVGNLSEDGNGFLVYFHRQEDGTVHGLDSTDSQ